MSTKWNRLARSATGGAVGDRETFTALDADRGQKRFGAPCLGVLFGGPDGEAARRTKVNPLTYLTYVLSHVRDKQVTLLTPDEFTVSNIIYIG